MLVPNKRKARTYSHRQPVGMNTPPRLSQRPECGNMSHFARGCTWSCLAIVNMQLSLHHTRPTALRDGTGGRIGWRPTMT